MNLTYEIIHFDGRAIKGELPIPDDADKSDDARAWQAAKALCQSIIGEDAGIEHVNVWHEGRYMDMFVDGIGQLKGLPRNERATAIYRANSLAHEVPTPTPESMPDIAGDAVLFFQRVWK